jgi:hypothetical protein
MKKMLDKTRADLEWQMKLQTLMQVVVVYGSLAIVLPVLYAIFKGQ